MQMIYQLEITFFEFLELDLTQTIHLLVSKRFYLHSAAICSLLIKLCQSYLKNLPCLGINLFILLLLFFCLIVFFNRCLEYLCFLVFITGIIHLLSSVCAAVLFCKKTFWPFYTCCLTQPVCVCVC